LGRVTLTNRSNVTRSTYQANPKFGSGGLEVAAFDTLLYIADPADAEAVGCDEDAADRWPSVWLKHIGDLELVLLWSAVADLSPEPGRTLMGDLLFQGGEDGPFVMRVPMPFVVALADLPAERVPAVAATWGGSEELADWRPEELAGVISELREFTQRAKASGQAVLQVATL